MRTRVLQNLKYLLVSFRTKAGIQALKHLRLFEQSLRLLRSELFQADKNISLDSLLARGSDAKLCCATASKMGIIGTLYCTGQVKILILGNL